MKVHAFTKLLIILEDIQNLALMVQDEWEYCLDLHLSDRGDF